MKTKNMLRAMLSMTAALMMSACSSNIDTVETPDAGTAAKTIPFVVTADGGAETRATVDTDNRTINFAEGDKLYISGTAISGTLDIEEGAGTDSATFAGNLTYTGEGMPANDLELTATLVSAQQTDGTEISIDDAGAVTVNYPTKAYCTDVNEAVEKYSQLTGTSTYGKKAFSLTQQTAFLNFEITFKDGTATDTALATKVSNNDEDIFEANVTTTTEDENVVAKFVVPIASGTELSGATLTIGDKEVHAIKDANLTGKVYNVKWKYIAPYTLAESTVGMMVDTQGRAWDVADKAYLPSEVTLVAMVAYKSDTAGESLAIALKDETTQNNRLNCEDAISACENKTPVGEYTWKLPSMDEYKLMLKANGGNEEQHRGLNSAINAAGGTRLIVGLMDYWTVSEKNGYGLRLALDDSGVAYEMLSDKGATQYVRACFAF